MFELASFMLIVSIIFYRPYRMAGYIVY